SSEASPLRAATSPSAGSPPSSAAGNSSSRAQRERARARARRRGRLSTPERPELVAEEVERHHEHDCDRLRHDLAPAEPVEEDEQPELVDGERGERDDEEAQALLGEVALLLGERPEPVPPVVV